MSTGAIMRDISIFRQIILLLFFLSCLTVCGCKADEGWVTAVGVGESHSIAVDNDGYSYITGKFYGNSTFGESTLSSKGSKDIFVVKMDSEGKVVWARSFGGTKGDEGFGIAVDKGGNSYITGYFWGIADFGGKSLSSKGTADVFVMKLDPSGNLVWVTSAGGGMAEHGLDIAINDAGDVYISGLFYGTAYFGSVGLSSNGWEDLFIAKLNSSSGTFVWATSAGGGWGDKGNAIAVDSSGNCFVTGGFTEQAKFGSTTLSAPGEQTFVTKIDSSGKFLWTVSPQTIADKGDRGNGIVVDASSNTYVVGRFVGKIKFGQITLNSKGDFDVFVAKFDPAGKVLWATTWGGANGDYPESIALDGDGNTYVTGDFFTDTEFGGEKLVSHGNVDIFIAMVDSTGNPSWSSTAGGVERDEAGDLGIDGSGNIYVTGSFVNSANFGETTVTAKGLAAFLWKIPPQ